MEHDAAIDVSWEGSSVCVVDAAGGIVGEAKVPSEPEALVAFFAASGLRIGLEAGPLSQWLHAGGRVASDLDRDTSCQGGAQGDDREERSQRSRVEWRS